jgi:hypothetical protein
LPALDPSSVILRINWRRILNNNWPPAPALSGLNLTLNPPAAEATTGV